MQIRQSWGLAKARPNLRNFHRRKFGPLSGPQHGQVIIKCRAQCRNSMPARRAILHRGKKDFCNAVNEGGEMTLWVMSDRSTMVARCPLLTRKRPDRYVAATDATDRSRASCNAFCADCSTTFQQTP